MVARGSIGERPLAARYRSLFVVGRGGMGSVEAALELDGDDEPHGNAFERIVALKRLLPDAARDKRRVDMFLREAKLASLLDHPNVVSAYDYGELDGELYLAMEYVEGQALSRVLRALAESKEQLPVSAVAYVLAEVCRGLHAAHELTDPETKQALNLVHRDVSPQNVMLGYDGRVRLLDFGVAKIESENHTKTGEVKGKSAYMSPEQAMGDPLDRRSDFFGVGAILFECLALRRMWGDGTDMDVIRKLALESPPTLAETGRTDLPEGLAELYAKLVGREPRDRPATAAEIATALDAFVGDAETQKRGLRKLLDAHFAGHAAEQRARLTSSLHEVAPAQADALRESMLPVEPPPAATSRQRSAGTDVVTLAEATPAPSRRSRAIWVIAPVAVLAIGVVWRIAAGGPAPTTTAVTAVPIVTALPAIPTPTIPAMTATTTVTAPAPTPAPAPAPAEPKPPTTVIANPTVVRPPPSTTGATATPPVTTPRPTAAPPPTPTASAKPHDVDDHPF